MVDYKTRQELNTLSKELFGSSSRWQKLVNKGFAQLVTEEVNEIKPAASEDDKSTDEERTVKVKVPTKRADGALQSTTVRHTVESVMELMLKLKVQRDEYLEKVRLAKEEQKAKQEAEALAKRVHEEISGSVSV